VYYFEGGRHRGLIRSNNLIDLVIAIATNQGPTKAVTVYFEPQYSEEDVEL